MKSEQLRFWEKVRIGWPDECWLWQAGTDRDGYGRVAMNGGTGLAHRYALLAAHGRLDDERHVLHSCDNPPCCNPRHLRLGTNADNVRDKMERGQAGGQKLDHQTVRDIRRLLAGGVKQTEIAASYNVTQQNVSMIATGKSWGWLK